MMAGEQIGTVPGPGPVPVQDTPAVGDDPAPRGRRGHRVLIGPRPPAAAGGDPAGTRERILEAALDLFLDQGFDKTSLREIAERVGVTKAALYYHFESKDDLLFALHLPVHQLMHSAMDRLGDPAAAGSWLTFLDWLIDQLAAHSRHLLLYQRNAAAFGEIHRRDHGGPDVEPEQLFVRMLGDPALSLDQRVRMAGSLAVVVSGAALAMQPGATAPDPAQLAAVLRVAVRDLLRVGPSPPPPPPA
jgi:AcrR family transcriptional regulator